MKQRQSQKFLQKSVVFKKTVWQWYRQHAPVLPWRETKNPYHIFVSEIMLQQTQIPRVLKTYPQFLRAFPTTKALAKAPLRRVLSVWHGMGYNRRGLYLQQGAKEIVKTHDGKIPKDISTLDALPGIGPYSARAVACFAYGICEPFIETNIRRVIIHEFFPHEDKVADKEILIVLEHLQPQTPSLQREWYWALMDYGREALKKFPNANQKSKHYAKQSKFKGSPRYIRANIISYVLKNKKATTKELWVSLREDVYLKNISASRVEHALKGLIKQKLITQSKNIFLIA